MHGKHYLPLKEKHSIERECKKHLKKHRKYSNRAKHDLKNERQPEVRDTHLLQQMWNLY
jgi:hypothetical protein